MNSVPPRYDIESNFFLLFLITVDPLGGADDNEDDLFPSKPKVKTVEEPKPEVKLTLILTSQHFTDRTGARDPESSVLTIRLPRLKKALMKHKYSRVEAPTVSFDC